MTRGRRRPRTRGARAAAAAAAAARRRPWTTSPTRRSSSTTRAATASTSRRCWACPRAIPVDGVALRRRLDARVRGTVAHALLERLDFAAPAVPDAAEVRSVARARGAEPTAARCRGAARTRRGLRRAASCAPAWRPPPACAARRRSRSRCDPASEDGLLVTGVVDVIAHEGDRALIVDYKTDRLAPGGRRRPTSSAPTERSDSCTRWPRCATARPRWSSCTACSSDRTSRSTVTYRAADRAALERRLEELAGRIAAGEFDVSPRPNRELCAGCPGRGSLCSWPLERTMADPPPPDLRPHRVDLRAEQQRDVRQPQPHEQDHRARRTRRRSRCRSRSSRRRRRSRPRRRAR